MNPVGALVAVACLVCAIYSSLPLKITGTPREVLFILDFWSPLTMREVAGLFSTSLLFVLISRLLGWLGMIFVSSQMKTLEEGAFSMPTFFPLVYTPLLVALVLFVFGGAGILRTVFYFGKMIF